MPRFFRSPETPANLPQPRKPGIVVTASSSLSADESVRTDVEGESTSAGDLI